MALHGLAADGHEIALVVTRPDRRRGRGGSAEPSPVKRAAAELGLTVSYSVADAAAVHAELGVVVAYGRIVPADVLAALPMVNLHFSLLARWRGAAPVERAILAGDAETGVCLMALDEGLDTGPVYDGRRTPIGDEETAEELRMRLAEMGTAMLLERLAGGLATLGEPRPQEGEPTYASKVAPSELRLDWQRPAAELARVVRVGRAWTTVRGSRLLVRRARALAGPAFAGGGVPRAGALEAPRGGNGPMAWTPAGALELLEVQPEGRSVMPGGAWWQGARLSASDVLGA